MAKVTFGLRRLSDALEMLTPKKFSKKKYFRLEDEEDLFLTNPVSSNKPECLSEGLKECPRECPSLDKDKKV